MIRIPLCLYTYVSFGFERNQQYLYYTLYCLLINMCVYILMLSLLVKYVLLLHIKSCMLCQNQLTSVMSRTQFFVFYLTPLMNKSYIYTCVKLPPPHHEQFLKFMFSLCKHLHIGFQNLQNKFPARLGLDKDYLAHKKPIFFFAYGYHQFL